MVDTKDLKSFGHYGCAGSSPAPGTENSADNQKIVGTIFFLKKFILFDLVDIKIFYYFAS